MIIEKLLELVSIILTSIFDSIPNVPSMPVTISDPLESFVDLVFNNAGVVGVFLPLDWVKLLIPLVIIVIHFDDIYHAFMWVIRKIPFFNIS